jgi:hypothetical protein
MRRKLVEIAHIPCPRALVLHPNHRDRGKAPQSPIRTVIGQNHFHYLQDSILNSTGRVP